MCKQYNPYTQEFIVDTTMEPINFSYSIQADGLFGCLLSESMKKIIRVNDKNLKFAWQEDGKEEKRRRHELKKLCECFKKKN